MCIEECCIWRVGAKYTWEKYLAADKMKLQRLSSLWKPNRQELLFPFSLPRSLNYFSMFGSLQPLTCRWLQGTGTTGVLFTDLSSGRRQYTQPKQAKIWDQVLLLFTVFKFYTVLYITVQQEVHFYCPSLGVGAASGTRVPLAVMLK